MLEVLRLSVAYGRHRALDNVSVKVAPGEIVIILGANGAGKSSLLKSMAGLVPALPGGEVRLGTANITRLPAHLIVEEGLALVPEGRGVFGELTVRENLLLGANPRRARAGEAAALERVLRLFPRLSERMTQTVRTMSGGEQQMVAIGRALMSAPEFLLLDEPSLGLSPLLTRDLFQALLHIKDDGIGLLLVEQNAKQGLAIADRGYLLNNGRILGEGSATALGSDEVVGQAFLGRHVPTTSASF